METTETSLVATAAPRTNRVMGANTITGKWLFGVAQWRARRASARDSRAKYKEKLTRLAVAEETLKLAQQVLLQGEASAKVVTFSGLSHGCGSSAICAQTARTLAAHTGQSVCLVEANSRSPSLPGAFGTKSQSGLFDCLTREGPIRSFATPVIGENVWLLSLGANGAAAQRLLNSDRLKYRLQELRKEFDFVVIDAAPMHACSDAMAIARQSDGMIMVLEAGSTRRAASVRAANEIRAAGIQILGVVLNKRTFPIPESLYRRL
jgi:protein-tyrosine kinase